MTGIIENDRTIQPQVPVRLLQGAGGLACLALAWVVFALWPQGQTVAAQSITVVAAEETDFTPLLVSTAKVTGDQGRGLTAPEGGAVIEIVRRNGDAVEPGDLIARLENLEVRRSVAESLLRIENDIAALAGQAAESERQVADAARAYREARHRQQIQQADLERYVGLEAKGFASAARMSRLREDTAFAVAEAAAAQSLLDTLRLRTQDLATDRESTRSRLQALASGERQRLEMLDIRAPQSGILSGLTLSIGATVRPGDPVARVSAGPSDQIEAQVLDAYATDLRVGGQARILDQSQVLLTIVAIDPEVREGTVSVRLAFASPPSSSIRAGQTIQVAFHVGQPRRAVVVPFSDVVGPGTAWIVDDNGKTARRRPIELGARAADKVEVRSGIRAGDRVIASSRQSLEGLDSIEIAP